MELARSHRELRLSEDLGKLYPASAQGWVPQCDTPLVGHLRGCGSQLGVQTFVEEADEGMC